MFCTELTAVNLPDTLVSIGKNAFANCPQLTEVQLPGSVVSIGKEAFDQTTRIIRTRQQ